jgi:glycosyltransferase involved in cell wall biosynthesis
MPNSGHTYSAYVREYSVALFMTFLLSVKVLGRHGFDVIHAANPPDIFFPIGLVYRLLGKRYVFDQHDLSPEVFATKFGGRLRPLHWLLLVLEWCSYRAADLVITTNESQKRFAITRGRCPPGKVCVVRNGPDLRRLRSVTPEPDVRRGRRYLLAYVGQMAMQDGIEYALHALRELVHKRGRRDVSLVLLGDGPCAPALRALARDLGLDPYVHFTGFVGADDLVRYLTVADVGLTPDPKNGMNEYCTMEKTLEYMAMGKPGVAFDLHETRQSAQDAALYATPNDIADYASKIETLLDDEDLRLRMGGRGRRYIEDALSWEHSKRRLVEAYERLFSPAVSPPVSDANLPARRNLAR